MNPLIACCGLDCAQCDARIATLTDDPVLREKTAALWTKLNGVTITPEMLRCTGCRVEGAKTPFCDSLCPIRGCAREKGLETCADCGQMDGCRTLGRITDGNPTALTALRQLRGEAAALETERLRLRRFMKEDAEEAHALFRDEEAMRLAGMYPPLTRPEETKARIDRWAAQRERLAIVLKETGALIGYIVVKPDSEEGRADTRELGFALLAAYRHRGYMREAVRAVLDELTRCQVGYVWACCFRENAASERLIRGMGFEFQQEGRFCSPNDREYETLEFRMRLGA